MVPSLWPIYGLSKYPFKENKAIYIFTDFNRFNETHFWSQSRQQWLNQFGLQILDSRIHFPDAKVQNEFVNPEFTFFDLGRDSMNANVRTL